MTDSEILNQFFSAWSEPDAPTRLDAISKCMSQDATYADPNCPEPMVGVAAINQMLGAFSQNMPGGTAWVVGTPDSHNGFIRAQIGFGMGGKEMMRGQYFAKRQPEGPLTQVIGFIEPGVE